MYRDSPRSIYHISNITVRCFYQTSIAELVLFVLIKSLERITSERNLGEFARWCKEPRIHVRILIYRTLDYCSLSPTMTECTSESFQRTNSLASLLKTQRGLSKGKDKR